jgi:signal transduction histidine kinase
MKRKLGFGFGLILILLSINAAISYNHTRRLIVNDRKVTRTYQVLNELDDRLAMTKDAETGARGYVITGQRDYLKPYYAAVRRVMSTVDPLDEQVWNDPEARHRVLKLQNVISGRLNFCRQAIRLRRREGAAAAQQFILKSDDKQDGDAVKMVRDMQDEERALLERRLRESEASASAASLTIGVAAIANLALVAFAWSLLVRGEEQRAKLEQAYRDLQRAEDMRDSLTAMLVHDLRTPLTTMIGSLEMLNGEQGETIDAGLRRELVTMSMQGGYRLLGLINQLLDISKMEAGQMVVRYEPLSVPGLIDEALHQVTRLDLGETTRISRSLPPDLPSIQGDHELLTRVLINLLGNAMKFTPDDGVITVGARPDGASMLFFVQDTGEGIPKQDLSKIFDKFGQAESRRGGHKMSTGLGLTFCKLAVEAHGGRIWVESELGKGSSFYFTVPFQPAKVMADSGQHVHAVTFVR